MKPGRLTREWVNGRRRPYLTPIQVVLLANLVYFFVQPLTHHLAFALHYYAWELAFIASFFLLAWGHLLRGTVVAMEAAGADPAALVASGGPFVQIAWAFLSEWSTSPLILAYLYLAIRRFYGPSRGRALLLAAAATVALPLITLAYRFLLFWITLATV